jgi:hypothetical protein
MQVCVRSGVILVLRESILLFILFGLSAWWSLHLPILTAQFPPALYRFCDFICLLEPLKINEARNHEENPNKLKVVGWDNCLLNHRQHDLVDPGLISRGNHSSIRIMLPIEGEEGIGSIGIDVEDLLESVQLVMVNLDSREVVIGDEEIGMHVLQLQGMVE